MRVAYICADPGVPVFGSKGSSVHVQSVIRALVRRGAHVTLFAARFDGDPPPELGGVVCRLLPRAAGGAPAAREAAMLAANADLAAALAQSGPFDLVYERYSLWSYAGMEHARSRGLPGLLEVNAPLIDEQERHRVLLDRPGAERVAWRAFGAATALLAVSAGVASYLRSFPAAGGRVHVVPNGVDPRRFSACLGRPVMREGLTIGFVGTLKPWHGLDVLVEAVALVRRQGTDARLLLVGDGPERQAVERRIDELGLCGARLTGAVTPEAVPALLAEMDVAAAPYPALDACYFSPLKLFEYMAAGRAIVASATGQVTEVIAHEESGLLCPPGDAAALAAALRRLADDRPLRARLGEAARDAALRRHTWDAVAGTILDLAARGAALDARVRHA